MATLVLSAAGAAIGSGFGGTILGLSGAVIGRAVGSTLGRVIDQRLLGSGSDPVETGRVERFRLMGASEGAAVAQVFGRARVAGQVIWATRFMEHSSTSGGGGKGAPSRPKVTSYSYSVSLALALCSGRIGGIGRIWADGVEISPADLTLRVYPGDEAQLPDPKIEAVEGAGMAPAYRGIAYVVIEDMDLSPYGNRVPQLSFEVIRPAQPAADLPGMADVVQAVALIPGTGEYALATTKVHFTEGDTASRSANVNTVSGKSDFDTAMDQLETELPQVGMVSLIVSWFGDDLRCGQCLVQPKVEQAQLDGSGMAWRAGGITRAQAVEVPRVEGYSVYGGTPADAAVIEAIQALRARGKEVMFYPFILMEQMAGNALPDPWTGSTGQPVLPWRGRITLDRAPGQAGSTDRSAAAAAEVAAFFGTAAPGDFAVNGTTISYSGPADWRYRRFILHYAHLCAAAGGVDAFCIGSEMRGLTQIRAAGDAFPAVTALRQLAAEVRAILGPATKISYAADWSEYFGYHVDGDVYFHLDPLWADANIDFVGIDNYMPLSDWREGEAHADAHWGSIHALGYLTANVAGGEGYDWYYPSAEARAAQRRAPITDGAHGEDWVFRVKDLRGWWENLHHDRIGGTRAASPSAWLPGSKPIRFTEYGCAAIDKGTNEPNKFLDPKSSESALPRYSDGRRDDALQMQYLRAMHRYWTDADHNPEATLYAGPMLDMGRSCVWAWDARPFPAIPNNSALWNDGGNYARGHWLNGRGSGQGLDAVVAEICETAGLAEYDVSGLHGVVRGYELPDLSAARNALQPLSLAYGFDALDRDGLLRFRMRRGTLTAEIDAEQVAISEEIPGRGEFTRVSEAEMAGRVLVTHIEAEGDFAINESEAQLPFDGTKGTAQTDLALVMTRSEGRAVAERWLAEARVARDSLRLALPRSLAHLGAGDVIGHAGRRWRIDRVEQAEFQTIEAVRTEPGLFRPADEVEEGARSAQSLGDLPVYPVYLDLPLLTEDSVEHAPHVAVTARPWPGAVAVWSAPGDEGYVLNRRVDLAASIGRSESAMAAAAPGLWDRGPALRVKMSVGTLASASETAVMNGANAMAIGNPNAGDWEVFQFCNAVLVGLQTWELSTRLRGQLGTDGVMPAEWPAGSQVVLLNDALVQLDMPLSARGLDRHYRVGRAGRSFDDQLVVHSVRAFRGVGLRPYAPAHLRAERQGGDLGVTWTRRTRRDGDSWEAYEVPLAEDSERYLLHVLQGTTVLRDVALTAPGWTYTAAMQGADGASGAVVLAVAQVSASYGPGPFARVEVTL